MTISRRTFLAGATVTVGALVIPDPVGAAADQSSDQPLLPGKPDDINYALTQNTDHWGEQLLARPDGPTFDGVKSLLGPANVASRYVTESGYYYLPMTDVVYDPATWLQQRDFAIHVADGSQITAQWCWAQDNAQRQWVTFQVGTGHEVYGSAVERLGQPRLSGGYLPILANDYTAADHSRWVREAFSTRVPETSALVSFVRLTVRCVRPSTLRLYLHVDNAGQLGSDGHRLTLNGNTYLVSSAAGSWNSPNFDIPVTPSAGGTDIYLAVLNTPAPADGLHADAATYQRARRSMVDYWNTTLAGGAMVDLPEPYAMDALRNLLVQNLVMGWQQSIGNGYETSDPTFAFVPEVSSSVSVLGDFGFTGYHRKNIQQLLGKGQGNGTFPNWEKGIRLQSAVHYFRLSNDASYLRDNLATFQGYLDDFVAQRAADPNGLLERERYGSDIPQGVYGVHHQTESWRGMRDFGLALRQIGENTLAQRFLDEAAAFHTALLAAIQKSWQQLPDGSLYIPISLLDPTAPKAYPQIPATRDGSYWNLTIPYALATGILPPGSPEARGALRYFYEHGGLLLGLTRFNEAGIDPPGVCESGPVPPFPPGSPGYDAPGVDEQYGYSLLKFFGDNDEADRLVLSFYGKLAQDLTPYTFIGGEGATVSPCPDLPADFRSQWFPPLSANNAVYLRAVREMLVHEQRDDTGTPKTLHLTPATPRPWLADGKRIEVRDLPTLFGPVSFSLVSNLRSGTVTATVTPPRYADGRLRPDRLVLHLRTPSGVRLDEVTVNDAPGSCAGESVDLGVPDGPVTVLLRYRPAPAERADQARPTVVTPARLLFQGGDTVPATVTVEALGDELVTGRLTVQPPAGWATPRPVPFAIASYGRINRQQLAVPLRVPAAAGSGRYPVTLTARPRSGAPVSRQITIEVAVPDRLPYAQLVAADRPSGYWRLGETSGNQAADSSGNNGTASYQGTVSLGQPGALADDPDGAVRLVDGYVNVPDSPAVSLTGPFTLEAWIMVTTSRQQGIIEKYDGPANNGYVLRTVEANKLFAQTLTAGPPPAGLTGPTTVLPGLWHHVAAVYDGARLTVYLDGETQSSMPYTATPTDGSGSLKLGALGDVGAARLDGWLDEVAVYPRPLAADRIKAHFVKGALGAPRAATS